MAAPSLTRHSKAIGFSDDAPALDAAEPPPSQRASTVLRSAAELLMKSPRGQQALPLPQQQQQQQPDAMAPTSSVGLHATIKGAMSMSRSLTLSASGKQASGLLRSASTTGGNRTISGSNASGVAKSGLSMFKAAGNAVASGLMLNRSSSMASASGGESKRRSVGNVTLPGFGTSKSFT
jgi:hypothetical protein